MISKLGISFQIWTNIKHFFLIIYVKNIKFYEKYEFKMMLETKFFFDIIFEIIPRNSSDTSESLYEE